MYKKMKSFFNKPLGLFRVLKLIVIYNYYPVSFQRHFQIESFIKYGYK